MKLLIKLLIVVAVLNATARAAMAAWSYYQFKDASQQTLVFGANATTAQLHDQIARRAEELQIPVKPEDIEVTRDGPRTVATASYKHPVELFPRYWYSMNFSFSVDALAVNPATAGELVPGAPPQ
jgi:hypothetical protein